MSSAADGGVYLPVSLRDYFAAAALRAYGSVPRIIDRLMDDPPPDS